MFPHFSFGKNGADNYADVRANAFCQIFADRNHLPLYNFAERDRAELKQEEQR